MSTYRSKAWCLTSYEEKAPVFSDYRYFIIGEEKCPTTGKKHWQCYVYYKSQKRFNAMKRLFPTAHIEVAKGNPESNKNYCGKESVYSTDGVLPVKGKRNDIEAFIMQAKKGTPVVEMIEDFPVQWTKYYRAYDRALYEFDKLDNKFAKIEVIVLWGDAGSGKTRYAYDNYPNLFNITGYPWYDGYFRQETILFDDFYGRQLDYGSFLRLTDGYKFNLQIKGGFTWKKWKRVIITSNQHPKDWFPRGFTTAIKRRITEIRHCTGDGLLE